MKAANLLRIGAGASFADDRIAPAVDLAERGELDYLVFECLAERTIARENLTRIKEPDKGYTPRLLDRVGAVLPACLRNGIRIVSNMGAANPVAAARAIQRHAKENALGEVRCAYKVTVGYHDGYIGEGQISYAGINAVQKAKWAAEIVQQRLKDRGFSYPEVRVDLIGMSSVHGMAATRPEPYEVRLRIAVRTDDRKAAEAVGFETRALHVNGPGGGGGGSDPVVREILAVQSVLLPRELVDRQVIVQEAN